MIHARITSLACGAALAFACTGTAAAQVIGDFNAYEFPSNGAIPKAPDAPADLPAPPKPGRIPGHTPEFSDPRGASDPATSQRVPPMRKGWGAATPQPFQAAPQTTANGKYTIRQMPGRAK